MPVVTCTASTLSRAPFHLYDVVSDVGSYATFVPFCTHSRMEAELTVNFLAFTECYRSRVTCVPSESVLAIAVSSTPLFKTLETKWHFQAASPQSPHLSSAPSTLPPPAPASASTSVMDSSDAGPTFLSLDLSYAFANPVHAAVSGTFFGKVSAMMVRAFEERCIEVYGPGVK
ncbi:cyclase/dehydrase [Lactifluus volemus]|nr:cyclase/dehydrase [Lactifluus volemus]